MGIYKGDKVDFTVLYVYVRSCQLFIYLSSSNRTSNVLIDHIEAVRGPHHPPVCNNGGSTSNNFIRTLGRFLFSVDLRQKLKFPTLEVCLSEVRVRPAISGLYFLN